MADYKFQTYEGDDIKALLDKLATLVQNENITQSLYTIVNGKVATEETRATRVENSLGDAINTEVAERQAAISALDFLKDIAANNGLSFHIEQRNGKIISVECSLLLDNAPTQGSAKPVTSAGVKSYVDEKIAGVMEKITEADPDELFPLNI